MCNGVEIKRLDMNAQELRQVAGRVKDGRVSRRLLAIALVLESVSRKVAAESCGMDRQTLANPSIPLYSPRLSPSGEILLWEIVGIAIPDRTTQHNLGETRFTLVERKTEWLRSLLVQ